MSRKLAKIYALLEPGGTLDDISSIRYIGYSTTTLKRRLYNHKSQSKTCSSPVYQWISSLDNSPEIVLLEDNVIYAEDRERWWMIHYEKLGASLLNVHYPSSILPLSDWDRMSTRQKKAILAERRAARPR